MEAIMEQYTKLDFTDQDIYIGLDIHKKNWTVSILSRAIIFPTNRANIFPTCKGGLALI
jgi:hypothetical protein